MSTILAEFSRAVLPREEILSAFDLLDQEQQGMDEEARKRAAHVQTHIRALLGSAKSFDDGCKLLMRDALAGKATEVQGVRERFLGAFQARLAHLRKGSELARRAGRMAGIDLPEAVLLEDEAKDLGENLARLAARWQTAEDLEDLAAESLAPSRERFLASRDSLPFPQAWHEENTKPF